MRVALYRRVSTDMQAEEGFSLEAQKIRLQAYAESQGWTIVADYCDEGYSAKNTDRPSLQQLIRDIEQKKFDIVLVYRLDRFVRSVLDLHELLQHMERHGVKFKSATEVFDTTSATGRLFITLIATLAQWERETIAERVHMGMTKKVQSGERNGAPAPYGYNIIDGRLVVNENEAKWVKYIYDRYGSVGSQTIAKELNSMGVRTKKGEVWSDFSVRYILKNPIYAGYVRWNYETYSSGSRKKTGNEILTKINQDDFVPLISYDKYREIQQLLKDRSANAFRSDNFYPFSGVAKCGKCGYTMTGAFKKLKNGKIHRFYKCRGRISFGVCDMPSIAEEALEASFLELLNLAETDIQIVEPESILSTDDIQRQIQHLERKKDRAKELYIEGDISKDKYISLMDEYRNEEMRLFDMLNQSYDAQAIEEAKALLRDIKKEWSNFSYETRKTAIHSLFKSLTVNLVQAPNPAKRIKPVVQITDYELI